MQYILETKSLTFSYKKGINILNDINLQVPEGSIYGILGRNGVGKSTLIKILLGLLSPDDGKVLFWGTDHFESNFYNKIGSMIEEPAFYSYMTVREHLKMMDILFNKGPEWMDSIIDLTGLSKETNKKAVKLSSGLKQRLALAMALYRDPEILILDEPTNNLDPVGILEMRNLILNLHRQGKTIVYSSHILAEIERICTYICVIEDGTLKYQGPSSGIEGDLESFFINLLNESATKNNI